VRAARYRLAFSFQAFPIPHSHSPILLQVHCLGRQFT